MKKNKLKLKNLGFTLVELLVVIAIIGILTIITASSFVSSQKKSRDASRKSELRNLSNALNIYFADNGLFPLKDTINGLIESQGEFADNSNPNNKIIYMKKVPKGDASGMNPMLYEVSDTKKSFRLYANLENEEDKDCICYASENKSNKSPICSDIFDYNIINGCGYVVTSSNIGTTETLP